MYNIIKNMLEHHGMPSRDAVAVLNIAMEEIEPMVGRWNEIHDKSVVVLTWITVKDIAIEYINDNRPNAWYRPMFMKEMEK